MRQDRKLVWIRQDLGDEATLEDFARKFLEIFGDKVVSVPQQKKTVLELYSKYAPSGSEKPWSKECDLPPSERVAFQRVWKSEAPDICKECGTSLNCILSHSERKHNDRHYCSEKCRLAGVIETCFKCKRKLDEKNVPPCIFCKPTTRPLNTSKRSLELTAQLWYRGQEPRVNHEPAWKRRRRSSH